MGWILNFGQIARKRHRIKVNIDRVGYTFVYGQVQVNIIALQIRWWQRSSVREKLQLFLRAVISARVFFLFIGVNRLKNRYC